MSVGTERIAIISDVHGNLTALEAVLKHARASGITRVFNLGDLVGKGPRSAAVVDRCRELCEVTVQGNWDAEIAGGFEPAWAEGDWHREQLGAERLSYLATLPGSFDFWLSGRLVRLFHASPVSVHHRVYETADRAEHEKMFHNTAFTGGDQTPTIVGYGDIHTAYSLSFAGKTLFNAGSVGNALDLPLACYTVLEGAFGATYPSTWALQVIRLPDDVDREIDIARASGMPKTEEYSTELRTAVYRGRHSTL